MVNYDEIKDYYREWELIDESGPTAAKQKPFLSEKSRLWMWSQRRLFAKGALDPKRQSLLDDIGFHWSGPTKRRARQQNQEHS